jgi:hypothetical protein
LVLRSIQPGNAFWYIFNSSSNVFRAQQFELASDRLVSGDYNGDGKTDISVYRDGMWYSLQSTAGFKAVQFGVGSDIPLPFAFVP